MEWLLKITGVLLCAGVLIGCVCRVTILRPALSTLLPAGSYITLAAFTAGVGLDFLRDRSVDWYVTFGLVTAVLHFVRTQRSWTNCDEFEKGAAQ